MVYRLDKCDNEQVKNYAHVCADLYKQENGEVVLKDTYRETDKVEEDMLQYLAHDDLVELHIGWCDGLLATFEYESEPDGSVSYTRMETFISIENDKFNVVAKIDVSNRQGGIAWFQNLLTDKTYLQTDNKGYVSQEDIDKGIDEFVNDMNNIGLSSFTVDKRGFPYPYDISYPEEIVTFDVAEKYEVPEMPSDPEETTEVTESETTSPEETDIPDETDSPEETTIPDESTSEPWKKAYADFLGSSSIKYEGKFCLAYIDNDDIPELICTGLVSGSNGMLIYKYSPDVTGNIIGIDKIEGAVAGTTFNGASMNKSVAYLEKQNLICVTDARTNGKYYYLYTIENDELKENGNISFGYLNKDFSIDGNPATEDECNAKADEYKIPDMTAIDRDAMYDINEENVIKYLSVENDTQETEKPQNNNTNNNNNNNNNTKNNTANNGGKSATADKTGVSPDTGDKGTGIALCVAASAVMAAWITRKKD